MSSTYAEPIARLEASLDEIGECDPVYRTTAEKQEVLAALSRAKARVEAEVMRVLACADDVAELTGARSTAAWLAEETRDAPGAVRRTARLAKSLDRTWSQVAKALQAGRINLAQVRVVTEALDSLPDGIGDDLRVKAETWLVEQAQSFGPRELAHLGRGVLQHLAPEIADSADYQRLLAEEDRARAVTRLRFRRRGDGTTDIYARVADHVAGRLRVYLDAFVNPRRPAALGVDSEFVDLPVDRRQGIGFAWLLENICDSDLPVHGGTATSIVVTTTVDQLRDETAVLTIDNGHQLTAGQLRRLACTARILPAVLGGKSEILDLGHDSRLFRSHQRKGMRLRDKQCTTIGCTIPAAFCDAHHKTRWVDGGETNLADGTLLCPFHHDRAHDPKWIATYHRDGTTGFARRPPPDPLPSPP
jgi:hypothetical protein